MSRWTLHLRLQQILTLECAIRPLNLLQEGTSPCTPELKWGSRMHVLIEGSLNGLHCCGNETPAANEHRLDCFLGSEWAKAAPQIQSVLLILPPPKFLCFSSSSFSLHSSIREPHGCYFTPAHKLPPAADNDVVLFLPPFAVQLPE